MHKLHYLEVTLNLALVLYGLCMAGYSETHGSYVKSELGLWKFCQALCSLPSDFSSFECLLNMLPSLIDFDFYKPGVDDKACNPLTMQSNVCLFWSSILAPSNLTLNFFYGRQFSSGFETNNPHYCA